MIFRRLRAAAIVAFLASLTGSASAQNVIESGPASVIDLNTAPILQNPPIPPVDFDRPTPRSPKSHRRVRRHRPVSDMGGFGPQPADRAK